MDSRISNGLAGAAQRARLLVNGTAGLLTERQRVLAMDLLRELEQLCDAIAEAAPPPVEVSAFEVSALCVEAVNRQRFAANRKQIAVRVLGAPCPREGTTTMHAEADREVVLQALTEGIGAAIGAAAPEAHLYAEITRAADRVALDVTLAGWNPHLPPPPPKGAQLAISVLRTAQGARLVMSMPMATTAPSRTIRTSSASACLSGR